MRRITYAFALLTPCYLTTPTLARAQGVPMPSVITASGRGEVHAPADHAMLTITVETHEATASAAAAANARAMTSTLAALHRQGIADSALSTSGFSVGTDYTRPVPSSAPAGTQPNFMARNGVRLSLASLARLGTIIDTVLAAGATSVAQPQYTSSRLEELRQAALAQAVEHARADAAAIARAAGGTLGPLIEIATPGTPTAMAFSEVVASPAPIQIRGVAGGVAGPPTPLAASDVNIAVTVTARWAFVASR